MNRNNTQSTQIQDAATTALAAASKTPFMTAFKITLGIGMARFVMFVGAVAVITLSIQILK